MSLVLAPAFTFGAPIFALLLARRQEHHVSLALAPTFTLGGRR